MKPVAPNQSGTGDARSVSLYLLVGLFLLAILVRLPALLQCLWYDEMFTFLHYISQPWGTIVSGHYSPNNHVLFTLLSKICDILFSSSLGPETAIRLPSLLASAAVAPLISLPLIRQHPRQALLLGLVAALHPWLISFGTWARGYGLLMFLAVTSTLCLSLVTQTRARLWLAAGGYILSIAALLYTHPIGIAIPLGHGIYMLLPQNRRALPHWLLLIIPAALLTILLYLPFLSGAHQYWSAPEKPTVTYAGFLAQALRHAHMGMDSGGIGAIIITLLICIAGPILAWRNHPALRPLIATFATASLFALLAPVVIKLAGEARAALWLIPLYCIGLFGLLSAIPKRTIASIGWAIAIAFLAVRVYAISTTPGQPITDALAFVQDHYPKGTPVIGVYMSSLESRALYDHLDAIAYALHDRGELPGLLEHQPPTRHVLVVFYQELLERDQPDLAAYIQTHYTLVQTLPGRVSGIHIYISR